MSNSPVTVGLGLLVLGTLSASAAEPSIRVIEPDRAAGSAGAVVIRNVDQIQTSQTLPRGAGEPGASISKQVSDVLDQLDDQLEAAGSGLGKLVKLNVYLANDELEPAVREVLKGRLNPDGLPAVSWVTTVLPDSEAQVAMDAVGWRRSPPGDHAIQMLDVNGSAVSVLPATVTSRSYVSGQAEKGDGTLEDATRQTMASLLRTLRFLELGPHSVVQVKAFLTPMEKVDDALHVIRQAFLPGPCPPVAFVEWQSSLPIEIELVAGSTSPPMEGRASIEFLTPPGMTTPTVYCRVARVHHPATIFVSGLYGHQKDPDGEAELRELFDHTRRLVEAGGGDLRHLVKATYYVSAPGSNQQHNRLRPEYYDPLRPPAASKAQVQGVGRSGRTITWDMIAIPKE